MQQLFRLALLLGERVARPLDVRTGAAMPPFVEGDSRPDVDGLFVMANEVLIEARQQQLLDAGSAIGLT
jgi:hypothetical protein